MGTGDDLLPQGHRHGHRRGRGRDGLPLGPAAPGRALILTATLTDQDARQGPATMPQPYYQRQVDKWEQSPAMDGPWTLVSGETKQGSYDAQPPMDADGKYLRSPSPTPTSTATTRPPWPCRPMRSGRNRLAGTPLLCSQTQITRSTRSVNENSPPGTNVGKPVTAGDAWRHADLHPGNRRLLMTTASTPSTRPRARSWWDPGPC